MAPRARTITVQVNPEADFSGVITDVGRQFRKIKEEATKVESGVTKAMRSAGKRIVEPFRKSAADIPAAYDGIGGRIRANLARAAANVGDVASRISKPFREAADKIKGVAGRIAQPFRNIGSKLKGVGQDIIAPFRKAADGIPKEFDGVGDRIKSKFSGLGGLLAGGLGVGAGVALAGSVASGFAEALDFGAVQDKLGAQLGVSAEEAERLGGIAGNLYADAYGDSLDEVATVVGDLQKVLSEDEQPFLESVAAGALDMQAAFGGAAQEYVQLAGQLTDQGVFESVGEGLDFITTSFQELPSEIQGDLLEATKEYGTFLSSIGFSTEETFGLLTEAAKGGTFELDKTGDALKEFQIRATDMSTASVETFGKIGLDAQGMANQILAGGETARDAFGQIVDGLLSIEDPTEQANAAITLFGTPLEDIGVDKIPAFLSSLDTMGAGFEDVAGAAEAMGDQLNDNLRTKLEGFRRKGLQKLAQFMSAVVVPAVEGLADVFTKTLGPAIDFIKDQATRISDVFRTAFAFFQGDGDVVGAFFENQATSLGRFVGSVARVAVEVIATVKQITGTIADLFSGSGEGTVGGIKDTINGLLDSITPLISAIGDFFVVLQTGEGYEDFNQNARKAAEAVRQFAGFLIDDVVPAVQEFAGQLVAGIGEVADLLLNEWLPAVQEFAAATVALFVELWPKIQPLITQLVEGVGAVLGLLVEVFKFAIEAITFIWDRWGDEIFNVAKVIFEAVIGVVGGALDIIIGVIKVATAVLQGDWSAAWDGVKQILSGAWEIIKSVIILGWEAVKLIFRAAIGIVKILFNELWDGLKASLSAAWEILKALVSAGWDAIKDNFSATAEVVSSIWSGLWDAVKSFVSDSWENIKETVSGGASAVVDFISGLPGRIADAASGMFNGIWDAFIGIIDRIAEKWDGLSFSIPKVDVPFLGSFGGQSFSPPSLPFFANGNVATGPTLGVFGEYPGARSNPEITTPESLMASVFRNVLREQGGAQRGGNRQLAENIQIYTQPGRDLAAELDLALKMEFG